MRGCCRSGGWRLSRRQARAAGAGRRRTDGPARRRSRREWWELNELGTILHGERTGATLRLGDRIELQVVGVEPARGRADLAPAGGERAGGR